MGLKKLKKKTGPLPKKRTINFAAVDQKKKYLEWAIPGSLLIIALAAAGSKYLVTDRMYAVYAEQKKVRELQKEIEDKKKEIESFGEFQEDYEYYALSGFTEEELGFTNRITILDLLDRVVFPEAVVSSWTLTGNTLRLPVGGASLQDLNELVRTLEQEESVAYCYLSAASKGDAKKETDLVAGDLIICMDYEKLMDVSESEKTKGDSQ